MDITHLLPNQASHDDEGGMSVFADACCGIGQLHARFMDAAWRQDSIAFADCFTPDGVWKIAGMVITGRDEIEDSAGRLLGMCERIQLVGTPPILKVDGARAQGRQHMLEFSRMRDGSSAMTIGIYHDLYANSDGTWRFVRRHWSLQYRGPADLSAAFVDSPDYGAFPGGPGPDDPTYVRPPAPAG